MDQIICDKKYIESKIKDSIKIDFLEIIDQSQQHANHYPVKDENISHLKIKIKSDEFNSKNRIQCHQKIYSIFNDEIRSGLIHAIQIEIID
jgi:stress-induced morphogen